MLNKNLLRVFVATVAMVSSVASLCAYEYQKLQNLPAAVDLIPNNDALKKTIDQVLSSGDNAGNLFKAYYFAVNLDKKVAQAAKAKISKPNISQPDLMNPAVAAFEIIKGIVSLLNKVQADPQIASGIITQCFFGNVESDGSLLISFLSAKDPQAHIANEISDYPTLEKFRREIALFARNLAWSLPSTYAKWQIWENNFAQADKNRSVQR